MPQINITTDTGLSRSVHNKAKKLFIDLGFEVEGGQADTGAIGGPFWHETNFIISVLNEEVFHELVAILAGEGIRRLLSLYRDITEEKVGRPFYITTELVEGIKIYFDLDTFDYASGERVIDEAIVSSAVGKMSLAVKDLKNNLTDEMIDLLGQPNSLILKYDYSSERWLIFQNNSDASIFFAGTPFAAQEPKKVVTNEKIVLGVLAIAIFVLGLIAGVYLQSKYMEEAESQIVPVADTHNIEFEQRVKCAQYIDGQDREIASIAALPINKGKSVIKPKVFFSPKLNTCISAYSIVDFSEAGFSSYYINDLLSNDSVLAEGGAANQSVGGISLAKIAEQKYLAKLAEINQK